jgi:hypothetical protein
MRPLVEEGGLLLISRFHPVISVSSKGAAK